MNARGYSLVEMAVVVGIVSTLLVIGTVNYTDYSRRYRAEAQTHMLYQELLRARSDALYRRKEVRVRVIAGRFEVYSSGTGDVAPARTLALHFPVICTASADKDGGYAIEFDSRGIAVNSRTICLAPQYSRSAVDSVVVSKTRVRIGRKDNPDVCDPEKITMQ